MSTPPKTLDFEGALERVENDRELYFDLVETLLDEYRKARPLLEQAVLEGDAGEIEAVAHSLKSAFGNIGAMVVFEVARDLEFAGKKQDIATARRIHPRLAEEVARLQLELDRVMHGR